MDSFSLTADMMYVSQNAPRICRAAFEICLRRGWPAAAELTLTLCKVEAFSCFEIACDSSCLNLNLTLNVNLSLNLSLSLNLNLNFGFKIDLLNLNLHYVMHPVCTRFRLDC